MTKKITLDQIKKLRERTKAGVMDCRMALEASGGDMEKAAAWLMKKGIAGAAKRQERETANGYVGAYTHHDGRVGALVSLACETDFVARTDDFQALAREIAMQVAATEPEDLAALLAQPWIREASKTIDDLVKEMSGKTGEKVVLKGFCRLGM